MRGAFALHFQFRKLWVEFNLRYLQLDEPGA